MKRKVQPTVEINTRGWKIAEQPKAILHIQGCCREAVEVQLHQSVMVYWRHGNERLKDHEGCGAGIAAVGRVNGVEKNPQSTKNPPNLF